MQGSGLLELLKVKLLCSFNHNLLPIRKDLSFLCSLSQVSTKSPFCQKGTKVGSLIIEFNIPLILSSGGWKKKSKVK